MQDTKIEEIRLRGVIAIWRKKGKDGGDGGTRIGWVSMASRGSFEIARFVTG